MVRIPFRLQEVTNCRIVSLSCFPDFNSFHKAPSRCIAQAIRSDLPPTELESKPQPLSLGYQPLNLQPIARTGAAVSSAEDRRHALTKFLMTPSSSARLKLFSKRGKIGLEKRPWTPVNSDAGNQIEAPKKRPQHAVELPAPVGIDNALSSMFGLSRLIRDQLSIKANGTVYNVFGPRVRVWKSPKWFHC